MTDPLDPADDTVMQLRPPPRPRWVIWLVIGIALAALVFLGLHLLVGGRGPMNHVPGTNHGMPAPFVPGPNGGTA